MSGATVSVGLTTGASASGGRSLSVAVIGAGGMGNVHGQIFASLPDVRIAAVADIIPEKAQKMALKYGARAYPSMEELLSHEEPDIAMICTPTDLHAGMAVACLGRKINVLCEKPMALQPEHAARMVAAAQQNGVKLMIAQVIRFWPEYAHLRQVVKDGTYGALRQLWLSRVSASPAWSADNWFLDPARSGLVFWDMHIHDLDYLYHLLGKPSAVTSVTQQSADHISSYIKTRYHYPADQYPVEQYPDGILVEAEGGWYRSCLPFAAGYRAVFEDAVLAYSGGHLMVYSCKDKAQELHLDQGLTIRDSGINLTGLGPYLNEDVYFVGCVRDNRPVEVAPPEESLGGLRVLTCELQSAREGRTVAVD